MLSFSLKGGVILSQYNSTFEWQWQHYLATSVFEEYRHALCWLGPSCPCWTLCGSVQYTIHRVIKQMYGFYTPYAESGNWIHAVQPIVTNVSVNKWPGLITWVQKFESQHTYHYQSHACYCTVCQSSANIYSCYYTNHLQLCFEVTIVQYGSVAVVGHNSI